VRRAASPFVALAVLLALGCRAENEESGPTTTTTPHTPMAGTLDRLGAQAEARSVASQAASPQDVSFPPDAFTARCTAPGGAARSSSWRCTVRSADDRCRGTVELAVARDGTVAARRQRVPCRS